MSWNREKSLLSEEHGSSKHEITCLLAIWFPQRESACHSVTVLWAMPTNSLHIIFFYEMYEEYSAQLNSRQDFWPFDIFSPGQVEVRRHRHLNASLATFFLPNELISPLLCLSCHRTQEDGSYLLSSPLGAQVLDQEKVSHSNCFIH